MMYKVHREYHRPATSHWQTLSHNIVEYLEKTADLPQVNILVVSVPDEGFPETRCVH